MINNKSVETLRFDTFLPGFRPNLYYNASMLNRWMEECDRRGESEKSTFIKHLSPVAWTHINFQGRYEFLSPQETIDIDAWLDKLRVSESDFKMSK